ncbi:MAG TPA: hypothetical protein DDW73_06630 [Rhizobium sp.]|nr:hypothetical protein [Rhizobium sp.]
MGVDADASSTDADVAEFVFTAGVFFAESRLHSAFASDAESKVPVVLPPVARERDIDAGSATTSSGRVTP